MVKTLSKTIVSIMIPRIMIPRIMIPRIMILSIMILSIKILSIMILSIMILNIMILNIMTVSITIKMRNVILVIMICRVTLSLVLFLVGSKMHSAECRCVECRGTMQTMVT
jgi:hypothetical protein